jgi:zinc D-Ala-D-Ala carboxypeptidase
MKVSEHISYREATASITARRNNISNIPDEQQLSNMRKVALKIFEPLRAGLGNRPIWIASFFRSQQLNSLIGGAVNSQHMAKKGAAMDIDNDNEHNGPTNAEIFYFIHDNLEFDQLIWEYGDDKNPDWVHVSYNEGKNRRQVLKCVNGKYINVIS